MNIFRKLFYKDWVKKSEYEELETKNRMLESRIRELEGSVKSLQESLDKVQPTITELRRELDLRIRYIMRFNFLITEDEELKRRYAEIEKSDKKKKK